MRGTRIFKDTITSPIIDSQEDNQPTKRGRNSHLIEQRDKLLLTRYWYYANYSELRIEAIFNRLSNEFFLSPVRVSNIISSDQSKIWELRQRQPTIDQLRKEFPFFTWQKP